jgi:ribosome assembly protein 1
VDAVEGVCPRTHQVVREAHSHQLVPILVINKVDRLCTDLCLTPTEAYLRLRSLIESVNATSMAMVVSKHADRDSSSNAGENNSVNEEEEARWTFEPLKGNVIFGSALYGWGFSVPSLGRSLFRSKALPIKPMVLKQYLFGDFKYKDGKVLKWKSDSDGEPLFAEFALRPIWEMYEGVAAAAAVCGCSSELLTDGRGALSSSSVPLKKKAGIEEKIKANTPGMDQVLAAMQTGSTSKKVVPASQEELQLILNRTGASTEEPILRSLIRRYRPLSNIVLDSVYEQCPSPAVASSTVRPRALALRTDSESLANEDFQRIQKAALACDASLGAPVLAHVCSFISVDRSHIVRDPDLDDSPASLLLGLCRVLSGRLKTGYEYYVMGPKHSSDASARLPKRTIRLYLLMGSSFVRVDEVPAGHLCAVLNLEDTQLKTATLCDSPHGMPLQGFDRGVRPLVKVNVESVNAADTAALERGLVKLSLADSGVEVTATAKGERLLACLGELHLEQSILDLEQVYCGKEMKLRISDPIVEFGETTDWFDYEMDYQAFLDRTAPPLRQVTIPPYNEEEGLENANCGRARCILSGRIAAISIRVIPLSANVYSAIKQGKIVEGCEEDLIQVGRALGCQLGEPMDAEAIFKLLCDSVCSLDDSGNAIVESKSLADGSCVRGIISDAGEINVGMEGYSDVRQSIREFGFASCQTEDLREVDAAALHIWKNEMRGSAVAGFQLAASAGPICEEPNRGVMVVLEGVEVAVKQMGSEAAYKCSKPMSGGMVVAALRSGIRCALLYVYMNVRLLYEFYIASY